MNFIFDRIDNSKELSRDKKTGGKKEKGDRFPTRKSAPGILDVLHVRTTMGLNGSAAGKTG